MVDNLREVVAFLVTPTVCYHSFIETYFEWNQQPKLPCGNMCSMCLGETINFTGKVSRTHIQSVITTLMMTNSNVTIQILKDAIWDARDRIFIQQSQMKRKSPIHALCLQLFAKGIIKFCVNNTSKIGTESIRDKDVSIYLAIGTDAAGLTMPACIINEYWNGINID